MSPLNFRWVDFSVFYFFWFKIFFFILLHFGEDLRLVFIQTGDHKIPAHKIWLSIAGNIEKEVTKKKKKKKKKKGGSAFGHQERVFGKIFTRA